MPRRVRLFVAGGIYHVYCKTHRGEHRFDDQVESRCFTDAVEDIMRTHGSSVLAWCLMTNHYHLVIKTRDVKLWRSMARIHGRVTKSFNRRKKVLGPGWQGRYRARLVQDGIDLRHLLAYVHLNPVAACLVDDPGDYRLSGHREIMGNCRPRLVNVEEALRCFEEDHWRAAQQAYLNCLTQVMAAKWSRSGVRGLPWWQTVGDDYETIAENEAPSQARTFDDRFPDLPASKTETVDRLLERAAPLLESSVCEMTGRGRRKAAVLARMRFTFIAAHHFNHSLKSIAFVTNKDPGQVSRWLGIETESYHSIPEEAKRVDEVAVALLRFQFEGADLQVNA